MGRRCLIAYVVLVWAGAGAVWGIELKPFQPREAVAVRKAPPPEPPTTTTTPTLPPTTTLTTVPPTTSTTLPKTTTVPKRPRPTTSTSTTTPRQERSAVEECQNAISRSVVPLAPGWVEFCFPAPDLPRGGAWSNFRTKEIHYDASSISTKAHSWMDTTGLWDFMVAHERCHSIRRGTAATGTLQDERETDACAAGYGVKIHWSVYQR